MSESAAFEAAPWQCACCSARVSQPLGYSDQFLGKALQQCAVCGHIQLARIPSAEGLRDYYSDAYSKQRRSHVGPAYMRIMARRARAQIGFISRRSVLQGRKFLDVGCGFGALLLAAKAHGADVLGLELDPHAADACHAKSLDVKLVTSEDDLADCIRKSQPDIVAMSHILEHLRDPTAILRACSRALVFVEVPRYRADVEEQFIDQEGHLHFFSTRSLERMLGQLSMPVLALEGCGPTLEGFWRNRGSWRKRLRRLLARDPFHDEYATSREDGLWIRALASGIDNDAANR